MTKKKGKKIDNWICKMSKKKIQEKMNMICYNYFIYLIYIYIFIDDYQ